MTEPPPIRCVVTVPGFHAASILPVSRTVFRFTIRMSVILSRGAERELRHQGDGRYGLKKISSQHRRPIGQYTSPALDIIQ